MTDVLVEDPVVRETGLRLCQPVFPSLREINTSPVNTHQVFSSPPALSNTVKRFVSKPVYELSSHCQISGVSNRLLLCCCHTLSYLIIEQLFMQQQNIKVQKLAYAKPSGNFPSLHASKVYNNTTNSTNLFTSEAMVSNVFTTVHVGMRSPF